MKQEFFKIPQRLLMLVMGLLLSIGAMAQITVNGHVKDASGEGVIGATVRVLGQDGGTVTDFEGNFTLKCQQGADLQVSSVGYQTVTVKAAPTLVVVLQDDAAVLNEVVVIGYGVAKKNDLTGSVTAIKPDEKNHGLVTNAQDMIAGKIAGVNVVSAGGAPGTGATIRVRGGASLNASSDPLIVIDGLAMDNQGVKGLSNPLSMVNPNDIESFTVLKDASATAIYGSRGSNGVIIITTKKGRKAQGVKVSYNGNFGVSKNLNLLDVMDGREFAEFIDTYYANDAKQHDAAMDKLGWIDPSDRTLGTHNTDWQKEIYQTAISHEHNVTVSGGLKNMPYRFSLGYTNQDGVLKTSNFERYTASFNINPTFFEDHLTVNVNGKYMHANTRYADTGAISAATRMDPTQPVRTGLDDNYAGYFQWTMKGDDLKDPDWATTQNSNATKNPVSLLNLHDSHAGSHSAIGNLEMDYKIHGLEDVHLHLNASGDYSWGTQDSWDSTANPNSIYYGWTGSETERKYNLALTTYAQYYKDFNDAHHFDIMGGYEYSRKRYWGGSEGYGLYGPHHANSDEGEVLAGTKYNESSSDWKGESFLVSFFGRANYILLDRYLFTATVRYDGSSRFYDHWALFPSFAFGWRMKDEAFLKDVNWLSDLKLRLGYGQTGQQDGIGNYGYLPLYNMSIIANQGSAYPIIGDGLLYRPNAYNKKLKWETTTTYNVGLDFGFWNNRVSGSIDAYYRKTTDLINTVNVPAGTNFRNQVTGNVGTMENKGVEASVTVRPIQTRDWQWEITANATYNKNEITATNGGDIIRTGGISAGTGNTIQAHAVGHPASSFWVYQQVYDEAGHPIEGVYVDQNADGKINDSDKYFYKSPNAPWFFGLSTRLQYKNWDFGTSFRASLDNYVYNDTEAGFVNIAKTYDSSFDYTHNILKSSATLNWAGYDNVLSDYFVQNASFIKCDNITLGYTFDSLFKGAKYNGLSGRLYLAATNVFTITKYKGLDPEVGGGIDNNLYPRPFTMQIGVTLNF